MKTFYDEPIKWTAIVHARDLDLMRIVTRSGEYTRDIPRPTRSSLARLDRLTNHAPTRHNGYIRLIVRRVTSARYTTHDYEMEIPGSHISGMLRVADNDIAKVVPYRVRF